MARLKCPNCGRTRVVMDGKRKRCRNCDTPLTATTAKAVKSKAVPVEPERKQKAPRQIKSLKALAKAYPDLCAQLAAHGAQEACDRIAAMSAEAFGRELPELAEKLTAKVVEGVKDYSAEQFTQAFPELAARLSATAGGQPDPASEGGPAGNNGKAQK